VNRRNFLSLIAAAAPAALIAPELILPKRTFFLPPAGGWAQPSLADIWLDFANDVRPAGVAVSVEVNWLIRKAAVYEVKHGHVQLILPEETDAELRDRMLAAMKAPREYGSAGTLASLMPWEDA
jgi:hypothetical protein